MIFSFFKRWSLMYHGHGVITAFGKYSPSTVITGAAAFLLFCIML